MAPARGYLAGLESVWLALLVAPTWLRWGTVLRLSPRGAMVGAVLSLARSQGR